MLAYPELVEFDCNESLWAIITFGDLQLGYVSFTDIVNSIDKKLVYKRLSDAIISHRVLKSEKSSTSKYYYFLRLPKDCFKKIKKEDEHHVYPVLPVTIRFDEKQTILADKMIRPNPLGLKVEDLNYVPRF